MVRELFVGLPVLFLPHVIVNFDIIWRYKPRMVSGHLGRFLKGFFLLYFFRWAVVWLVGGVKRAFNAFSQKIFFQPVLVTSDFFVGSFANRRELD